jgi:acetyl esterase/lipase
MRLMLILVLFSAFLAAQTPQTELLWPEGAPGAVGTEAADRPALDYWPAARPNGAAVLVCPGGGYGHLAVDHEGKQVAEWFNGFGVSVFVLKYRLGPRYRHPAPLDDARRAMRMIRERAGRLGLDAKRVGVMGFSAGGHLASTLSTLYKSAEERPDFSILVYPVISFRTKYGHSGSVRNLLGTPPDPELVWRLSTELAVTAETPPTFLFHTNADAGVPPENSVFYYLALRRYGVPAEMHIYQEGRHGVGLAQKDEVLSSWPARLKDWLKVRGVVQ